MRPNALIIVCIVFCIGIVVAIVGHLGVGIAEIATLDRRDFSVVRPSHIESFHLLP